MKIIISDQKGDDRLIIENVLTWTCQGNMLHLNKQHTGRWHLIHGKHPVPHLGLLKAIEFTDFADNMVTVEFSLHGSSVRRKAIVVYKTADHPYVQFEEDLSGMMTVYVTRNFLPDHGRLTTIRVEA